MHELDKLNFVSIRNIRAKFSKWDYCSGPINQSEDETKCRGENKQNNTRANMRKTFLGLIDNSKLTVNCLFLKKRCKM